MIARRCDMCRQPIRARRGYIEIAHVSEDGLVGGYPRVATPEDSLPEPPGGWPHGVQLVSETELLLLGDTPRRIAFRVLHGACAPDAGSGYWIDVREARTPEQWHHWVLHLGRRAGWAASICSRCSPCGERTGARRLGVDCRRLRSARVGVSLGSPLARVAVPGVVLPRRLSRWTGNGVVERRPRGSTPVW